MSKFKNINSISTNMLIMNKEKAGDLFFPFLYALMLKDDFKAPDNITVPVLPKNPTEEQIKTMERFIHIGRPWLKKYWQPEYAGEIDEADYILKIFDCFFPYISNSTCIRFRKAYKHGLKHSYDDPIIFAGEVAEMPGCDIEKVVTIMNKKNLVLGLVKNQTVLRRYIKGEVGLDELTAFSSLIIGEIYQGGATNEEAEKLLDAFTLFFDCVDADYLEPVPPHYEKSNREILEEITTNNFMDVNKRIQRMEMNLEDNVMDKNGEIYEFIKKSSFIGGQEFFYNISAKNTEALLKLLIKKAGEDKRGQTYQPYCICMNNLLDKKIVKIQDKKKCTYTSTNFFNSFFWHDGEFKIKTDDRMMYVNIV